jgi:hypothetical protein
MIESVRDAVVAPEDVFRLGQPTTVKLFRMVRVGSDASGP